MHADRGLESRSSAAIAAGLIFRSSIEEMMGMIRAGFHRENGESTSRLFGRV